MDNKSKYLEIFKETFNVKEISEDVKYNEIPEWDSIGHMTLMSALEEKSMPVAFKTSCFKLYSRIWLER